MEGTKLSTPEERAAKVMACKNVEELIELVAPARRKREAREKEGKDTSLFSLVIGNPPYTVTYEGASTSSHSVYPTFFLAGNALAKYSSIISPARWFNSPRGEMKSMREAMRQRSISFSKLYYTNEKLFPTATIGGGDLVSQGSW